jgi:nucleotide-binding universal stress UspA family protein
MNEVVVGVDGSPASGLALRWAYGLAQARRRPLRVIRTWQYPASAGAPGGPMTLPTPDEMDGAIQAELTGQLADALGEDAGGVAAEVRRGSAAGVLVHRAVSLHADVVVVGARGLGGFDRLLLGSTSRQCLEHAPCPVVIVRAPDADVSPGLPGRIVVGLDGSTAATRALSWAARLATDLGADIVALHALGSRASEDVATRARALLDGEWTDPLRTAGARYDTRLDARDPRIALLATAEEIDAGLIVTGTRGTGFVPGVLLGSVANHLAVRAHRPIAVVPAASETDVH